MKKRFKSLIVFTSLGTIIALAGAIGMKFDFSSLTRENTFQTIGHEFKDLSLEQVSFTIENSDVQLVTSSSDSLEITVCSDDDSYFSVDNRDFKFTPKINMSQWYNPFSLFTNYYSITIGIPAINNTELFLNTTSCNIEIQEELKCNNLFLNLKASSFKANSINTTKMESNLNASSINVKSLTVKTISFVNSASSIYIDQGIIDDLTFNLKASSLNLNLIGSIDEYAINIQNSASSVNVNNTTEGNYPKSISGIADASSIKIKFKS